MSREFSRVSVSKIKSRFEREGFDGDGVVVLPCGSFEHIEGLKNDIDGAMVGIVNAGSLRITINGVAYNLGEDQMFILYKDAEVEKVKVSKGFVGYMINFKSHYMMSMDVTTKDYMLADLNARTTPVFRMEERLANSINEVVISLVDVARGEQNNTLKGAVSSLSSAIFYLILSAILPKKEAEKSESADSYINRFIELLSENYARERSVEYYAQRMNITPKYLTMICRKHRGLTASRIIDDAVIHNAMRRLNQYGVSVRQVAEELNFPSQSFFGKYFKQRVGISPSRYKVR